MIHNVSSESPIGIFDSGIGGLTVVKAVQAALPSERIIYFGDTARVPAAHRNHTCAIRIPIADINETSPIHL